VTVASGKQEVMEKRPKDDLAELDAVFPKGAAAGQRYADMSSVNR